MRDLSPGIMTDVYAFFATGGMAVPSLVFWSMTKKCKEIDSDTRATAVLQFSDRLMY